MRARLTLVARRAISPPWGQEAAAHPGSLLLTRVRRTAYPKRKSCTPYTRASGPAAEGLAGEGADGRRSPARASRATPVGGAPVAGPSRKGVQVNATRKIALVAGVLFIITF